MIYFLYGTDSYRIREKGQELVAQFLAGDKSGINLEKIDGAEMSLARFEQAVSAVSFFTSNKVIVIGNLLTQNKDSELKGKIADKIKKDLSVKILFVESGEPDKREKLFKVLSKVKNVFFFGPLSDYELRKWITERVDLIGGNIDRSAVEALALAVGPNLNRLENEIAKLVLYVRGQNREQIKKADIELMVNSELNPNVFEFIEAIARSNKKRSVKLLAEFLASGENESYLLSMVIYQFRTLIMIADLLERGKDQTSIIKETRLHPFVVKKSIAIVKDHSTDQLIRYYQNLFETDYKIKTGVVEPKVALDLIVAGG